jgi:general stress protein YciG
MHEAIDEAAQAAMLQRARAAEAWEPGGEASGGEAWPRYYHDDVPRLVAAVRPLLAALRGGRIVSISVDDLDTMANRAREGGTAAADPNLNLRQGFATAYAHDVPWLVNELRNLGALRAEEES